MARGTRKALRRADLARRGLVALMGLALVLSLVWLRESGTFGGPERVTARVADAGGSLAPGADVKLRGVIVGKVDEIEAGPGGVDLHITMNREDLAGVPAGVRARVLPATVFGTTYVDLVAKGDTESGEALRSGAVIPADTSQGTLELQQALDDIDALVKAVGPAELASAIGSAAQALDGRGAQIGRTIERADAYLARLNPKMPAVAEDVRKLRSNLALVEELAPDFFRATEDALVTARTVREKKQAVAGLLRSGYSLAESAEMLMRTNEKGLIGFLDNSVVLLDAVYDNRKVGITGAFATNRALGEKIASVLRRSFAETIVKVSLDPPDPYTADDCPRYGRAAGDNCGEAVAP